ncbi:hypothetical protein CERSUDRAFT_95392 [Gelatoporia subvermispora B]|uniref:BTB domain-containing protein n=1 Tax=Ceriporiopsis subvermispora (strain B) TaxID=914234 RepID=M2PLC1_CERS8|nr:hypothetical protein CERSUDRAFT_95392 [Gelatoporia subvermispora B]
MSSTESPQTVTAPFDSPKADVVVRSSDGVDFPIRMFFLTAASAVFEGMFSLPQPAKATSSRRLPVVEFAEHSKTLDIILRLCYPIDVTLLDDFIDHARSVIVAVRKLQNDGVTKQAPLRIYAIACALNMEDLTRSAAKMTLLYDQADFPHSPELRDITGAAYSRLLQYHRECSRVACASIAAPGYGRTCAMFFCGTHVHDGQSSETYLALLANILTKTPNGDAAFEPSLWEQTILKAIRCQRCKERVYTEIGELSKYLKARIDEGTSKIELVFEQ